MKNIDNELAALLDRNNYRVILTQTDGGCISEFPARIEQPIINQCRVYQEYNDLGIKVHKYNEKGTLTGEAQMECPVYAQRLCTIYNIMYFCHGIDYNPEYIKFVVDNKNASEEVFLIAHTQPNMTDESTQQELSLKIIISDCMKNGFLPQHEAAAHRENVLEGFYVVRGIFEPDMSSDAGGQPVEPCHNNNQE